MIGLTTGGALTPFIPFDVQWYINARPLTTYTLRLVNASSDAGVLLQPDMILNPAFTGIPDASTVLSFRVSLGGIAQDTAVNMVLFESPASGTSIGALTSVALTLTPFNFISNSMLVVPHQVPVNFSLAAGGSQVIATSTLPDLTLASLLFKGTAQPGSDISSLVLQASFVDATLQSATRLILTADSKTDLMFEVSAADSVALPSGSSATAPRYLFLKMSTTIACSFSVHITAMPSNPTVSSLVAAADAAAGGWTVTGKYMPVAELDMNFASRYVQFFQHAVCEWLSLLRCI